MKIKHLISCLILLTTYSTQAQIKEYRVNYVNKFKDIAIREMERSGVPASIKLAQGILESDAGRSVLARRANNHFGIKCGSQWDGKTFYREDDDYDEFGNLMKSCFRVYRNAEASYVAHSEFLTDPRKEYRYGFLFRLDPKDYEEWAYGLKSAGYATNPNYPKLLIGLIETYNLDQYDSGGLIDDPIADLDDADPSLLGTSGIFLVNDVKTILAEINDTPDKISNRTGINVNRILKYNEKLDSKNERIDEGARVFLQRKRIFFRGRQKWHTVEEGENMFSISQLYGLRLDRLYRKNRMEMGSQPAIGERIKLRWRVRKDQVPRLRNDIKPEELPNVNGNGEELEMDDTTPFQPGDDIPPNINNGNNPPYEAPVNEPYTGNEYTPTNTPVTNEPYDGSANTNEGTNTGSGSTINLEPVSGTPTNTSTGTTNNTSSNTNNTDNTNTSRPTSPNVVTVPDVTDIQKDAPQDAAFHKVERGDTLFQIARKYGITVDDIKRMNNLNSDLIRSGWLLRIK